MELCSVAERQVFKDKKKKEGTAANCIAVECATASRNIKEHPPNRNNLETEGTDENENQRALALARWPHVAAGSCWPKCEIESYGSF